MSYLSERRNCCSSCKQRKPVEDFPNLWNKGLTQHKRRRCSTCTINGDAYLANKKRSRTFKAEQGLTPRAYYNLRVRCTKNKITPTDFFRLLEQQGNKCALCPTTGRLSLFIDHCHTTGRVRGLLCQKCNNALHHLMENEEWLNKVIHYFNSDSNIPS